MTTKILTTSRWPFTRQSFIISGQTAIWNPQIDRQVLTDCQIEKTETSLVEPCRDD